MSRVIEQGVGGAYMTFPHGSLEQSGIDGIADRDAVLLQSETGSAIDARQFLMYTVRPLDHPNGWLVGASYRSAELTKLFAEAALGYNPVAALLDTKRGILQAVVGPAARHPNTDLSATKLFGIISRSPTGTWVGDTLHAFHQVADRGMVVLVAANMAEVMAPVDTLASGACTVALVAMLLVLAIGGIVLWAVYTFRSHARQKRTLNRNKTKLERLRIGEVEDMARAQLNASRLQIVLD